MQRCGLGKQCPEAGAEMGKREAAMFRRSVARLNYLSLDRPDPSVAVNSLARNMARPLVGDEILGGIICIIA